MVQKVKTKMKNNIKKWMYKVLTKVNKSSQLHQKLRENKHRPIENVLYLLKIRKG